MNSRGPSRKNKETRTINNGMLSSTSRPLESKSILADTFIPEYKKQANLAMIQDRWKCDIGWIERANNPNHNRFNQDTCIINLSKNFIPAVPCSCGKDPLKPPPHSEFLYMPTLSHTVAPNFQFALLDNPMLRAAQSKTEKIGLVDLDETSSVTEYITVFKEALRYEYEEHLRLYESFSLYHVQLQPMEECSHPVIPGPESDQLKHAVVHKTARIVIDGIADARPTLQIGDIVLLRPICANNTAFLEIESRVIRVVRGQTNKFMSARQKTDSNAGKDSVIITWGLNHKQISLLGLKHSPVGNKFLRTNEIKFNIRFIPSAVPLERCLTALDWLDNVSKQSPQSLNGVLFPVKAPVVKPLSAHQVNRLRQDDSDRDKPLNELQLSFVKMVGARTRDPEYNVVRPPMILTGPAGTGKTKTLMVAIADVLGLMQSGSVDDVDSTKNRVLVCAPSHAAADVITHRLQAFLNQAFIFRLYDQSRPTNTVPATIMPHTCRNPITNEFTLPASTAWEKFRVIVCTCMDAHILFRAKITNEAIAQKRKCFRQYLQSGSHNLGYSINELPDSSMDPYFSHLFIDEAAQASEPEILIPISCVIDPYIGAKKAEVALIGDPRQLSPLIFSEKSHNYGLSRSFMERLLKRPVECLGWGEDHMLGPEKEESSLFGGASSLADLIRYYANVDGQELLTIFLCENYRGHPSFLMMPSCLFYFDRLRCKKDMGTQESEFWCSKLREIEALSNPVGCYPVQEARPTNFKDALTNKVVESQSPGSFAQVAKQESWPICFIGVKGEDKSVALDSFTGTDSWQNHIEAGIVLEIVDTLVNGGVVTSRIGVMAPFRGQVVLIRKYLRSKNYFDVNVGTIENYQGVEQDVVIFSMTRSNQLFVNHDIKRRMGVLGEVRYKQANVALTRAENLFIMLGHPEVMWNDPLWRQFLMFCFRNGLWYGRPIKEEQMKMLMMSNNGGMKMTSSLQADRNETFTVVSTLERCQRLS